MTMGKGVDATSMARGEGGGSHDDRSMAARNRRVVV
jgi:hypothetical protein